MISPIKNSCFLQYAAFATFLMTVASVSYAADVPLLVQQLASKDKQDRLSAIDALGGLGAEAKSAVPALTQTLGDSDKEVAWHAARALGAVGRDAGPATAALLEALSDDHAKLRAYAAFALGQIGDSSETVVDRLIQTAFDKDILVRRASIKALRRIDPPQEKTLPVVLKILEEGDPSIVMPTLHTLAEEGEAAVPRLISALQHERACYWACLVLAEIGPEAKAAVPFLRNVLQHPDPEVRLQALVTLGEIGKASESLTPDITAALESDSFDGVRYAASFALGRIGVTSEAATALHAAARSDDPFLRMISVWALARNNPNDKVLVERAINLIVEAFKSDDVHLRRVAAKAGADFDVPLEMVAPLLVEALKDKDPTVVGNAIEALAELGPKVLKQVDQRLKHKELRHYAVRLIYRMGPEAESAVPALADALLEKPHTEDDVLFCREVQFALAAIGPAAREAVPALVGLLSSEHDEIRATACHALGKIGPDARAAVPALRQGLDSENPIVKLASVRALLEIQPGEPRLGIVAAPVLIKALDSEHELIRAEAASALGDLGSLATRAIPRLKQLLKDQSPVVREAAADALKKLEG